MSLVTCHSWPTTVAMQQGVTGDNQLWKAKCNLDGDEMITKGCENSALIWQQPS